MNSDPKIKNCQIQKETWNLHPYGKTLTRYIRIINKSKYIWETKYLSTKKFLSLPCKWRQSFYLFCFILSHVLLSGFSCCLCMFALGFGCFCRALNRWGNFFVSLHHTQHSETAKGRFQVSLPHKMIIFRKMNMLISFIWPLFIQWCKAPYRRPDIY